MTQLIGPSYKITLNKGDFVLLLGSNLGAKEDFLRLALQKLTDVFGPLIIHSSLYETAPWGLSDQPNFLNLVCIFNDPMHRPGRLLMPKIQKVERQISKEKEKAWGARELDIDLLFNHSEISNDPNCILPHPRLHLRNFTLIPLLEILPFFVHPRAEKTIEELYYSCRDPLQVKLLKSMEL